MILVNDTRFDAHLLSNVIDDERLTASVISRVSYDLPHPAPGSAPPVLRMSADQPWTVALKALDTPHGSMESDLPFMKGGVDLFLFGAARAPKRAPVRRMEVRIEVGSFTRRALVTGARLWVRERGQLVPSDPEPFVEMPLTLSKAFGGVTTWDGLEVPFGPNPKGLGFNIDAKEAEGRLLPYLEEPDSPMTAWNDQPAVCGFGFCPMVNPARFHAGVVLDDQHGMKELLPRLFNSAYPPMVAPSAFAGEAVRVEGVTADRSLAFTLPGSPFGVELTFGSKVVERLPTIEQIGIEVEERRVFLTWRFSFRYTVRPREFRQATIAARA